MESYDKDSVSYEFLDWHTRRRETESETVYSGESLWERAREQRGLPHEPALFVTPERRSVRRRPEPEEAPTLS